jgi:hypothetical protein
MWQSYLVKEEEEGKDLPRKDRIFEKLKRPPTSPTGPLPRWHFYPGGFSGEIGRLYGTSVITSRDFSKVTSALPGESIDKALVTKVATGSHADHIILDDVVSDESVQAPVVPALSGDETPCDPD